MDLQKEREEFEAWHYEQYLLENPNIDIANAKYIYDYAHKNALVCQLKESHFIAWQAAKAQAVPKWISVKDKLPSDDIGRVLAWVVEQNSLGKCGFVWNCSHSDGVFSDKFETFQVTNWMPLPDAPQEPANE